MNLESRLGIPEPLRKMERPKTEISLRELDDNQLRGSLGSLVLNKATWSHFSLNETSRLLRPLQISPELTGTTILTQGATAEITYKFPLNGGRIGTMTGMISIEDFRGDRLGDIYQQLNIRQIIDGFTQTIVIQIIDHLRPIFARENDALLWQESVIFLPKDIRQHEFLIRGLRPEGIPRSFAPHLESIYRLIISVCPIFPNVAFQLCLRTYLEYNAIPNQELLALLLSKYFYTVFRLQGLHQESSIYVGSALLGSPTSQSRLRTLSGLMTIDNDSEATLLDGGGIGRGGGGSYFSGEQEFSEQGELITAEEFARLRQDAQQARSQAEEATQLVARYQEEEKQELLKRLSDPDRFLAFSLNQFFDDIFTNMPQGIRSESGVVWIPKTSLLDELKREELTQYLRRVTSENYLFRVTSAEARIIGYWRTLAEPFYNQWVLNQYKQLQDYNIKLESVSIKMISRERFVEEVELRFASRHMEIVNQNLSKIASVVVEKLAQRVAINTSQQSFQAMRAKLNNVLDMEISRSDVKEAKKLIDIFEEVFMGKKEQHRSPYPVGTILEVYRDLRGRYKDGRTLVGMEILSQIYQEYMAKSQS
ncbi:MAG: hypothetical protein NW237_14665 [Cyanobacteriota bacterium]|nr:hypothetical protein [Cyanobacteriota bacterium]